MEKAYGIHLAMKGPGSSTPHAHKLGNNEQGELTEEVVVVDELVVPELLSVLVIELPEIFT